MFGRATIMLGIGPHSSFCMYQETVTINVIIISIAASASDLLVFSGDATVRQRLSHVLHSTTNQLQHHNNITRPLSLYSHYNIANRSAVTCSM